MSIGKNLIYCIVPAYNEEKNIAAVLNGLKNKVDNIVVVDDCSSDNTAKIALNNGAKVLSHIINRGQGAALRTGTKYAILKEAEIIIHYDGDGQFVPADIEKFVEIIRNKKADAVFGSRFLNSSETVKMPWFKKYFLMPMAKAVNRLFFKINTSDPQCGFRAFSKEAAEKINWHQDRMAHCTEILYESSKSGLIIKEVPVKIIYHDFGQKLKDGLRIVKDLFVGALIK